MSALIGNVSSVIQQYPLVVAVAMFAAGHCLNRAFLNDCRARVAAFESQVSDSKQAANMSLPKAETFGRVDVSRAPPCLAAEMKNHRENITRRLNMHSIMVDTVATAQPITSLQSSDLMLHYAGEKVVSTKH